MIGEIVMSQCGLTRLMDWSMPVLTCLKWVLVWKFSKCFVPIRLNLDIVDQITRTLNLDFLVLIILQWCVEQMSPFLNDMWLNECQWSPLVSIFIFPIWKFCITFKDFGSLSRILFQGAEPTGHPQCCQEGSRLGHLSLGIRLGGDVEISFWKHFGIKAFPT